jgi:hypothetical protein
VAALRQTIRYTDLLQLVKKTLPVGVPFQGIPELARALDEQGVRTAVMAGPYCPHQRNKLKALRLDCLFGPIVYTDFFTRNPRRPVYQAIEKLAAQWKDLAPRDIAYIADNPAVDFPAARLGRTAHPPPSPSQNPPRVRRAPIGKERPEARVHLRA